MEVINNQKGCGIDMKLSGFAKLKKELNSLPNQVDLIIKSVLQEYGQKIFNDAMSKLPSGASSIKGTYSIEYKNNGFVVNIGTENEIAAYIEFGTGDFATSYLSGQTQEVKDDAIKFFVNGEGKMPAKPYLFPAYYKYKDQIAPEINKRIQALLNRL